MLVYQIQHIFTANSNTYRGNTRTRLAQHCRISTLQSNTVSGRYIFLYLSLSTRYERAGSVLIVAARSEPKQPRQYHRAAAETARPPSRPALVPRARTSQPPGTRPSERCPPNSEHRRPLGHRRTARCPVTGRLPPFPTDGCRRTGDRRWRACRSQPPRPISYILPVLNPFLGRPLAVA